MNEDRSLSLEQVQRLASLVQDRLDQLGDPRVRAPLPDDYLVHTLGSSESPYDFAVDVDIGSTILRFRDADIWPEEPEPPYLLNELADAICRQVRLVRANTRALARLANLEKSARAKIERDGLPLNLISVEFAHIPIRGNEWSYANGVRTKIEILDDMLLPHTKVITEPNKRLLCAELEASAETQKRRLAILDRMRSSGAFLEIEATAEHAIKAADRSTVEVVQEMIEMRKDYSGFRSDVILWYPSDDNLIRVSVREGCIQLQAEIVGIGQIEGVDMKISHAFPESVLAALGGEPLSALVEHEFLQGTAEIAEAASGWPSETNVRLKSERRLISCDELTSG